jgi:hypothetical protein
MRTFKKVVGGIAKFGTGYVDRSKNLYRHYNHHPETGELLSMKDIIKNNRFFLGGLASWYSGLMIFGGSFFTEAFSAEHYEKVESSLRIAGVGLMTLGGFLSSVFYSKMQGFKGVKNSFVENPGRTAVKLAEGFADSQIVAPTYKAMVIGNITGKHARTVNEFGGSLTDKYLDPICIKSLETLADGGLLCRSLSRFVVSSSEIFYNLYH